MKPSSTFGSLAFAFLAACGSSNKISANDADTAITTGGDSTTTATSTTSASDSATTVIETSAEGGIVLPSGRYFPDTTSSIAILSDQLPTMNTAQMQFAATHFVGTEKQVLSVTQALRAINSNFLVLHYHLCMWQSAPNVTFISDGQTWGNDYPTVTTNETWFWHNTSNARVESSSDQKLLMNVSVAGFQAYWESSLETQVAEGDYDGIMFDSASPALLQGECGGTGANQDPRLAGTAAADTTFPELGGVTWSAAWQTWIGTLSADLWAKGIPLIPNDDNFTTSWDHTDYTVTQGVFSEDFADTRLAVSDWQASTNELLKLASLDKILILQNYLSDPTDVPTRMYYLGNYLLVKGHHTYLDYFVNVSGYDPLEWYPEWSVDLGAPTTAATTNVADLASSGVYRRDFENGSVLVNPTSSPVTVQLGGSFKQVTPSGGGEVDATGAEPGTLTTPTVTSVSVGATTAVVVLK